MGEVVENALRQVGEVKEYSFLEYNCEHFATECKTGRVGGFSSQAQVMKMVKGAVGGWGCC
eukprot:NODE_6788_length_489_cov_16.054545_g5996_i0.p2 GENE.NODE_6788_length_489_cov_16.054545_g5996_i0~~NODE_6788_length_489_cov_16.054545_g5996_i0.p2  ORF type:complete len:70 (-),score=32.14 NODE_6788_length_489_cov_16.054545_g5996_i0:279-461(-)